MKESGRKKRKEIWADVMDVDPPRNTWKDVLDSVKFDDITSCSPTTPHSVHTSNLGKQIKKSYDLQKHKT